MKFVRSGLQGIFYVFVSLFVLTPIRSFAIGGGNAAGFEIDGNLIANTPGLVDWLDGPTPCASGSGGVLSNATPGGAKTTLPAGFVLVEHRLDGTSNNDRVFKGNSNKLSDDPNTYSWLSGNSPPKDDIGNAAFAFYLDSSNKLWVAVSGDRSSVNGDSYIDFEMLQNSLIRNNSGGFTSTGPNGGRTAGDFILTIHLTQGGAVPEFFAQVWSNVPPSSAFPSGYAYVAVNFPPNAAFVSGNSNFVTAVCYGSFGSTNYQPNAFGEGAANVSALLPSLVNNQCFHVSTVFIRTKSSTAPTAELKDFVEPIQAGICVDNVGPAVTSCPADTMQDCSVAQINFGTPTFTDNCSGTNVDVMAADTELSATCPAVRKVRRTWTATDACGNSAQCSQTISLVDTNSPRVVSASTNMTVVCPNAGTFTTPTFIDNCDLVLSITATQQFLAVTCPEVQKVKRTWTAKDDCGNSVTTNQTITWILQCTPPAPQPPLP
jgi:hypothetical protein